MDGPEQNGEDEDARHAAVIAEEFAIARSFARVTTPAERGRAFAILFVSLVCMGAGQSVLFTILPPVSQQLGLSPVQVTTIFAVSAAIWIFSSPYWGGKSDLWGRKPVMLMGLIAFAISFAFFASAMLAGLNRWIPLLAIYPLMIAARSIYGGFGSGTSPAAQAYVADRTTPRERLRGIAIISMAFALGTTFGPVIGSKLTVFGLLAPFYFISALALASALAVWLFLPERTPPRVSAARKSTLRWYEPRMLPFVAFGVILSAVASIPLQTIGFYFMAVLHADKIQAANLAGVGLMESSLAALFAQFVVVQRFRLSARVLTNLGLGFALASNLLFLVAARPEDVDLALVLAGLGFGMARPAFTSGASLSVAPHEQGPVAGLLGASGAAGFILGPVIGKLFEISPYAPYIAGVLCVLGMLAAMRLSHVLRHAGDIPPDTEKDEVAETTVPNA
jgi:MFS family permease